jgi:hypothetical protein
MNELQIIVLYVIKNYQFLLLNADAIIFFVTFIDTIQIMAVNMIIKENIKKN